MTIGRPAGKCLGSWNDWQSPGSIAERVEPGFWRTPELALPPGRHAYKFLLTASAGSNDPANPRQKHDGVGGPNSTFVIPRVVAVALLDSVPGLLA